MEEECCRIDWDERNERCAAVILDPTACGRRCLATIDLLPRFDEQRFDGRIQTPSLPAPVAAGF